jgi:hypothetical protein
MRIEINAAGAQVVVDSGDGPIEPNRFEVLRDTARELWREGVDRYETRLATDRERDDARPPTIGPTGQLAGGERRARVLDPLAGGWAYETQASARTCVEPSHVPTCTGQFHAPLGFEVRS